MLHFSCRVHLAALHNNAKGELMGSQEFSTSDLPEDVPPLSEGAGLGPG
jgi:hypothetical protein